MKHLPPSLYLTSSGWAEHPPTGASLARQLEVTFDKTVLITELARISGRSENYVEWQLSLDTVVPACLLTAALRLRRLHLGGATQLEPEPIAS
jgi:hypothetical protein